MKWVTATVGRRRLISSTAAMRAGRSCPTRSRCAATTSRALPVGARCWPRLVRSTRSRIQVSVRWRAWRPRQCRGADRSGRVEHRHEVVCSPSDVVVGQRDAGPLADRLAQQPCGFVVEHDLLRYVPTRGWRRATARRTGPPTCRPRPVSSATSASACGAGARRRRVPARLPGRAGSSARASASRRGVGNARRRRTPSRPPRPACRSPVGAVAGSRTRPSGSAGTGSR